MNYVKNTKKVGTNSAPYELSADVGEGSMKRNMRTGYGDYPAALEAYERLSKLGCNPILSELRSWRQGD